MFTLKNLCFAALTSTTIGIVNILPAEAFTLSFSPGVSSSLGLFGIGAGSLTIDDSVSNLKLGESKFFAGKISSGMATSERPFYLVDRLSGGWNISATPGSDTWFFGSWRTNVSWRMNIFCHLGDISTCEGASGYFFARSVTPYGDPFYNGMVTFHTSTVNKPPASSVPEPQTAYALLSLGALGLLERKWKVISGIIN